MPFPPLHRPACAKTCQINFRPIFFVCIRPASFGLHLPSRAGTGEKNLQKTCGKNSRKKNWNEKQFHHEEKFERDNTG
jgi:hypothetical protein